MTPARRHFLRVTSERAATAAAAEAPMTHAEATAQELMLAKLAEDRRRLKQVQSMERKAEVKREVLADYVPYVDGVLAANTGRPDDVLMTVMVWRIDAGDSKGALEIAAYAIEHELPLPDQYQRTTATLIAEEFSDAAKRARDGGGASDVSVLRQVELLTAKADMPDEVRAKLCKELGLGLAGVDRQTALDYLRRAMQLHDKVGVKKDIERLEREAKNAAATSSKE